MVRRKINIVSIGALEATEDGKAQLLDYPQRRITTGKDMLLVVASK